MIGAPIGTDIGGVTVLGVQPLAYQPVSSRQVLQDPVDCVLAGQQQEFKPGRAHLGAMRGIFRE